MIWKLKDRIQVELLESISKLKEKKYGQLYGLPIILNSVH